MRPLLSIEGLRVSFGETRVLHGVDFTIGKGEALGLVGESGSGKSVTWLAALGLLPRRQRSRARFFSTERTSCPRRRACSTPCAAAELR